MSAPAQLRAEFEAALVGPGGPVAAADRLCAACVSLLHVDGAAVSLMYEGSTQGTFGSSGELSRELDEYQFTFGEGPCMDAISARRPVLVPDLADTGAPRWPAYSAAVLDTGVHGVFALPVSIERTYVGVLDLFRYASGPLSEEALTGGLMGARLAALPLLDLISKDLHLEDVRATPDGPAEPQEWSALSSLERVEVYQATGMLMEHLGVGAGEALVRLRAHAFATDRTASEVAWAVVERRLVLPDDLDHDHDRGDAGAPQ